jgi:ion channel
MSLLRRYWSTDHSLTALLLFLCLNLFAVLPMRHLEAGGRLLVTIVFSLMLISGVATVAKNRLKTAVIGSIVFASLAVRWVRLVHPSGSLAFSDRGISTFFCAALALVVLAQVFSEGPITAHRIQGAVAVYLLIGLAFSFAYELVELEWSHAFTSPSLAAADAGDDPGSEFLYFSFVTLTTVGYGDITAIHPVARSLAMMEALIGQLFPSILLARLVSMELYYRQATHEERR